MMKSILRTVYSLLCEPSEPESRQGPPSGHARMYILLPVFHDEANHSLHLSSGLPIGQRGLIKQKWSACDGDDDELWTMIYENYEHSD